MIINDLDFGRPGFGPDKADTILVVDVYAVLALTVSRERFEAIARWNPQFIKGNDRIKLLQFVGGNFQHSLRTRSAGNPVLYTVEDIFGSLALG